ncbi:hypothetical protein HELRODRAFT_180167 [Helobdella robusta]|uniref:Menin n=1 Tax=Helobdella robusta TaxID=6412 RepID=T1FFJ3_HELRO|nr:hypothetical protein HELRODRAFT_180167 [Helobdella robusta]ESN94815.1 hypothetical protein HELRODRAFT_180167 [Helobdella robusta]
MVMNLWRSAADVVSKFVYSKEDEELYKLFYDVANNHIPDLIRGQVTSNGHNGENIKISEDCYTDDKHENINTADVTDLNHDSKIKKETGTRKPSLNIENWKNPKIFSDFLLFYDGLCCWEEQSNVPVLHETWAKRMCSSLIRFHCSAREKSKVAIETCFPKVDVKSCKYGGSDGAKNEVAIVPAENRNGNVDVCAKEVKPCTGVVICKKPEIRR